MSSLFTANKHYVNGRSYSDDELSCFNEILKEHSDSINGLVFHLVSSPKFVNQMTTDLMISKPQTDLIEQNFNRASSVIEAEMELYQLNELLESMRKYHAKFGGQIALDMLARKQKLEDIINNTESTRLTNLPLLCLEVKPHQVNAIKMLESSIQDGLETYQNSKNTPACFYFTPNQDAIYLVCRERSKAPEIYEKLSSTLGLADNKRSDFISDGIKVTPELEMLCGVAEKTASFKELQDMVTNQLEERLEELEDAIEPQQIDKPIEQQNEQNSDFSLSDEDEAEIEKLIGAEQ